MARKKRAGANVVRPSGNLEFSLAMKGKGGNLTHDPRPRRQRTRAAGRRRAIQDAS